MSDRPSITAHEFAREFHHLITSHQGRFAFFLGAGCSFSSGIPLAGALVHKHWLPERMRRQTGKKDGDVAAWAASNGYEDYTEQTAGRFYGRVIESLFRNATQRQTEIDRIVKDKHPAFGYGVLAKLLAHPEAGPRCNLILTTNFDDLVADALYLYGTTRPLVIVHEALIGFARAMRSAPLVVKLHGDHHLEPKNTERETSALAADVKKALGRLLADYGLIFMGYAGGDRSIAEALSALPPDCLPSGIYWINDAWPDGDFGTWLEDRGATWVKQRDFDETMVLLHNEFGLAMPTLGRFEGLLDQYAQTFKDVSGRLAARTGDQGTAWQEAAVQSARTLNPAWATLVERRVAANAELEKARAGRNEDAVWFALMNIGDIDRSLGKLKDARSSYEGALEIAERLAVRDPENMKWQRELSVSHGRIGDVRLAEGDRPGALTAYQADLAIAERLAARNPENMEWQRDLSVSYDRIGEVRLAEGDRPGALPAYQASLEIRVCLAARDPENMKWQRDLSVSHEKIGNVRLAEGDRPGALTAYQASLEIRERLAAHDPENMEWQRDLSVSHEKIGNVRLAEGDRSGALTAYQASLDIHERLAARDPENTEWQRDLYVSHQTIGATLAPIPDRRQDAIVAFREALAIVEAQSAAGKWAPADAHWEAVLRKCIADLEA